MCAGGPASLGLQAGGNVISAIGARNSAQAQKYAYDYDAQIADTNAQLAGEQAGIAQDVGRQNAANIGLRTGALFGTQRAGLAAGNVDLGSGSPNDVLASTKFMGGVDVATAITNAARQAWGYNVQATNFTNQANMDRFASSQINPNMAMAATLIGGAGQTLGSYGLLKRSGALS